ncbi:Zinc finger BED domain-containing protein RICESLEEPER 4, partial [Bienertia sinuspersici]
MADQDQQILNSNEFAENEKIVRGKKRSYAVWNYYDLITKTDGAWAVCKYCKHDMKAHGHVGTTNARRHTEKCDTYVKVEHIKTIYLHRYLNPNVKDISRYTITKYVMGEHE